MRLSLLAAALFAVLGLAAAHAEGVKIGVLTDMAGVTSDSTGRGSVEAAHMAAEDSGGSVLGEPIQVVFADHQHKADIGSAIARRWLDNDGVDVIVDVPDSAVALAVQRIVRDRNKIVLYSSAGTTALVQQQCSPNSVQWTYDTYGLAHGTASAVVKNGGKSWFIVGADYAFGRQLAADVTAVVQANGGTVLGSVWHPLNNADFSSYLLTAQAPKSQIIAIASAGGDATNAIKQAAEFRIGQAGQQLAAMIFLVQDAHSLGLNTAQGIYLTTAFYHDADDASRTWSRRFMDRVGAAPSMLQAGVYSSVMHYLKAVEAAGTKDSAKVMARMRAMPVEDFMTHGAHIREDGHLMRDMYLSQVKSPAESKGDWDLFKIVGRIPAEAVVLAALGIEVSTGETLTLRLARIGSWRRPECVRFQDGASDDARSEMGAERTGWFWLVLAGSGRSAFRRPMAPSRPLLIAVRGVPATQRSLARPPGIAIRLMRALPRTGPMST